MGWLLPTPSGARRLLPWLFRVGFDVTAADVWATPGPVLGARAGCRRAGRPMRSGRR